MNSAELLGKLVFVLKWNQKFSPISPEFRGQSKRDPVGSHGFNAVVLVQYLLPSNLATACLATARHLVD